jgi:hypothetical protein
VQTNPIGELVVRSKAERIRRARASIDVPFALQCSRDPIRMHTHFCIRTTRFDSVQTMFANNALLFERSFPSRTRFMKPTVVPFASIAAFDER